MAINKATKQDDFAVLETGGKQYRVSVGDVITIEKLPKDLKEGDKVTFDNVILIDDGKTLKLGTPTVSGSKIEAEFVGAGRHKKITVMKYKSKSRYFFKKGHKQHFNKVKITAIK